MSKLEVPGAPKALAENISADIDEFCVKTFNDGHRTHLGGSLIGHSCSRYLWYIFRWCFKEDLDGRKLRLFNRGHREEERFVQYLEGIGCKVWYENRNGFAFDPGTQNYFILGKDEELQPNQILITEDDPEYKKHVAVAKAKGLNFPQFRISDCEGHFGGSVDTVLQLPPKYGIEEPLLGEYKTNGTGSGFTKLITDGIRLAKPMHFAQISTYGSKLGLNYALYLNTNKNDDSIHCEVVKLDHKHGRNMIDKANDIIFSDNCNAPKKLSLSPTYFECQYCPAQEVCHFGKEAEVNCRSCSHARPVANKEWFCDKHNGIIPKDFIAKGCDAWDSIAKLNSDKR